MRKVYLFVGMLVLVAACGESDREVQRFVFEGQSMTPTLKDGDRIVAFDYAGGAPARGDVVAFALPVSPERIFFKRVIGLPGDTVEIDQTKGMVLVNGAALDEPYTQGATDCMPNACSWTIPSVEDDVSISREDYEPRTGPSPLGDEDEACAIKGCYFVLGDNRQNSSDSRQGWLVPAENIVGYIEVD